jgi:threonine synthase
VAAQAERANPLYLSSLTGFKEYKPVKAQPTLATAIQIGNPVSYEKAVPVLKQFGGIVEQATEDELANASALADRSGLFNCPHTGVALAVLMKLVERKEIKRDERVVVISTAHGLKFTDFKVKYHEGNLPGVTSKHANKPVDLPPSYDAVVEAIDKAIRK